MSEAVVEQKPSKPKFYVASRASVPERGAMWRRFRKQGALISSTWIDEDGDGQTDDFAELWQRIQDEVESPDLLVLYAEKGDFPLKGALIEVGIALGNEIPIVVCLPNVELDERNCRPIGSWINHTLVSRNDDIQDVMSMTMIECERASSDVTRRRRAVMPDYDRRLKDWLS